MVFGSAGYLSPSKQNQSFGKNMPREMEITVQASAHGGRSLPPIGYFLVPYKLAGGLDGHALDVVPTKT